MNSFLLASGFDERSFLGNTLSFVVVFVDVICEHFLLSLELSWAQSGSLSEDLQYIAHLSVSNARRFIVPQHN